MIKIALPNGKHIGFEKSALTRRDLALLIPGGGPVLHGYATRAAGERAAPAALKAALISGALSGLYGAKASPGSRLGGFLRYAPYGAAYGAAAHGVGRGLQRIMDIKKRRAPLGKVVKASDRTTGISKFAKYLTRRDLALLVPGGTVLHGYASRAAGERAGKSVGKAALSRAAVGGALGGALGAAYGGVLYKDPLLGALGGGVAGAAVGAGAGTISGAIGHGAGRLYQRVLDIKKRRAPLGRVVKASAYESGVEKYAKGIAKIQKTIKGARAEKNPMIRAAFAPLLGKDLGYPRKLLNTDDMNKIFKHYKVPGVGYTKKKGWYNKSILGKNRG